MGNSLSYTINNPCGKGITLTIMPNYGLELKDGQTGQNLIITQDQIIEVSYHESFRIQIIFKVVENGKEYYIGSHFGFWKWHSIKDYLCLPVKWVDCATAERVFKEIHNNFK